MIEATAFVSPKWVPQMVDNAEVMETDASRTAGEAVRGYVSCTLGCPYQREVPPHDLAKVADTLYQMGCEISVGDTIGVGIPVRTQAILEAVAGRVPVGKLAGHHHDTYGQALANIYAALQMGVAVLDSSVTGLGDCDYAQDATDNVATEDIVCRLQGLDATGVDLDRWSPPVNHLRIAQARRARKSSVPCRRSAAPSDERDPITSGK